MRMKTLNKKLAPQADAAEVLGKTGIILSCMKSACKAGNPVYKYAKSNPIKAGILAIAAGTLIAKMMD